MAEYLLRTIQVLQNGDADSIEQFYDSDEIESFFFGLRKKPGCLILKQNLSVFVSICEVIAGRSEEVQHDMELYEAMKPLAEDIRFGYSTLMKGHDRDEELWKTTFHLYKMTLEYSSPVLLYAFQKEFKNAHWKKLSTCEKAEFFKIFRKKLSSIVDQTTAEIAEQNCLGKCWNFLLYNLFMNILETSNPKSFNRIIQAEVVLITKYIAEEILRRSLEDKETSIHQEFFNLVVPKLCYENVVLSLDLMPICETIRCAGLSADHPLSNAATKCTRLVMGQTGITDDTNLKTHINSFLQNYATDPLCPTPELMVKLYLKGRKVDLIHDSLSRLIVLAMKMPLQHSIRVCHLTREVATKHPEVINKEMLNHIYLWLRNPQLARFGLDIICILCNQSKLRIDLSELQEFATECPVYTPVVCELLTKMAAIRTKEEVKSMLNWLTSNCLSSTNLSHKKSNLTAVRDIGHQHTDLINGVKKQIDKIKTDKALSSIIGEIENLMNGLSLSKVASRLEEAIIDIERIDRMAVNTTPKWSIEVAKLMNPESDADWKLMAKRLSFTNDDLKAWVTHEDPCISMLTEWFATHKSSEATRAVYIVLKEIGREDAADIVAEAIKKAGEMVPIDEPLDLNNPPAVFISYQWEVQDKAKCLKDYLTDAGFSCWMDIGQMGGGDKLYEKIDTGIRSAKVIVSLVTEKYAQSLNCNREMNLSVNLQKPIFPLLMDQMAWPPSGGMGPIFSEYLYFKFFRRKNEESEHYWLETKMEELLTQLRYWVDLDVKLLTKKMDEWWFDKLGYKILEIDKTADNAAYPDVFISYNWDKQPEIIELHSELTKNGFSCWLDVKQMGGGDSLYDKIDKGIRRCKVVISCVTKKYAGSLNCRREVSLSDNLKKPIIPLLLEEYTWPPEGPMSMALTELSYIDFSKQQSLIEGSSFAELLERLKQKLAD